MSFNTAFHKRTICEVLREIYDYAEDLKAIKDRTEEAMIMAKKMNKKLIEYKRNWDEDMDWEPNLDYEEDLKRRA